MIVKITSLPKKMLGVFLIAFISRIFLSPYGTYYNDLATYQLWSLDLIRYGFQNFYQIAIADYHPGYLYILWFTGKVFYWLAAHIPQFAIPEIIYKLPSMTTDIGIGFLIYLFCLKYTTAKKAISASLLFLFNPVFLMDSTLWGQIESYFTFFLFASVYALLQKKTLLSALLFAIAQNIKPIAILIIPFYIVYLLNYKITKKNIFFFIFIPSLVTILLFMPFSNNNNIIIFIIERYTIMSDWFTFTTLNSFNLWMMVTLFFQETNHYVYDSTLLLNFSYYNWGNILFILTYLGILFRYHQHLNSSPKNKSLLSLPNQNKNLKFRRILCITNWFSTKTSTMPQLISKKLASYYLIFSLALIYISMFMFLTRMRERHLYFGLVFLTTILPLLPFKKIVLIIPIYAIFLLNLIYSFLLPTDNPLHLPTWAIIGASLLNLISLSYLLWIFYFKKIPFNK
ncbi:hypothetical protein C4577_07715 [Candidatus Parcubacteria bacterium]|nr:MAG: hypothetical protein C4577_07715 [Candidatus Parcubacteria bacterium]